MKITEEKLHYDGRISRFQCLLLRETSQEVVLLYRISDNYKNNYFSLPLGSFTVAYYYFHKPYNLYNWISPEGNSLGYYFNIVKDVSKKNNTLKYKDLIIDVFIKEDLTHNILDLDELPCSFEEFEGGKVKQHVEDLISKKHEKIEYFKSQSRNFLDKNLQNLWDEYF